MIKQINPMLCYKPPLGKEKEFIKQLIMDNLGKIGYDEKKDGSRYLMHIFEKTPAAFTGRNYSSVTGKLTVSRATDKLEHLDVQDKELEGTVLDGEYMGTSAASMEQHPYYVFDCPFYKGIDISNETLLVRRAHAGRIINKIKQIDPTKQIFLLDFHIIKDYNEAEKYFNDIVDAGGEGLVLKLLNSTYTFGKKRKDAWIKWKKEETFDVIITGYKESDSQKYGPNGFNTFRHLNGAQYKDGELIEVTHIPATTFTDEMHEQFIKDGVSTLISKIAEVRGMERASKGTRVRHARFKRWREDKNQSDCTLD